MKRKINPLWSLLSLFIPYTVYLLCLPPTLTFGDSGDHITCGWLLGLAHPSGYCFYTIITHLSTYIPLGNIAMRISLITAIFSSCAIMLLFALMNRILNSRIFAFSSSMIFAFSSTFWKVSGYTKMYSLFALFVVLCFLIIFSWERERSRKLLYLLAFVYGLAVSNHMLMTTTGPALLYLVLVTDKRVIGKQILPFLLLFALGLSVYIYLPIRATANPVIDWGKPETLSQFLDYAFIGMAHEKMFKAEAFEMMGYIKEHIGVVTSQFTPYILIFTIPGAMALLREKRKVFWFLLLTICVNTFFGIGVYAKITELVDMEAYNLPTFICLSIFIGEGISCFLKTVKRIPNSFSLLLPLLPFFFNLYPSDYSRYYFAYDFGRNLLKDLPEKTVLFNRIDLDVFPLWYHQYVENFRRDVAVFPIHFIQRPWFIQNILKEHPWTDSKAVSGIMERMNRIRAEGKEIVGMYERTISAIIHTNCRKYPIYYTFFRPDERIDMPYLDRLHKDGLCYQVKIGLGEKALPKREHRFSYRGVFDRNVYKDVWAREILYIYSYYHADIGQHYLNRGEVDRAIVQLERSLKFDPENPSYMGALGAAYGVAKRYKDAVKILEKAVEADPENELFSQYLAMARANLRATSHQPH